MVTIEIKVVSDNASTAVKAIADATVDMETRGFDKTGRLVINKISDEFTFTQEFRRGTDDRTYRLQDVRDNGEPEEVRRTL